MGERLMNKNHLGIIAAMHSEIAPLLRMASSLTACRIKNYPLIRMTLNGRPITIIISGIGPQNAAEATHAFISEISPSLLINAGLAGSLMEGPQAGDIVLAGTVLFSHNNLFSEQHGLARQMKLLSLELAEHLLGTAARVFFGTVVTTSGIRSKSDLRLHMPVSILNPVVDMEAAAIAKIAARENVPLIIIKAISDEAYREIPFSIEEITDRQMNIHPLKLLWTVAKRPWIIPQLMILRRNANIAGKNLAAAVAAIAAKGGDEKAN
jgi:adenosylhomocysteine nucleosidase